MCKEHFRQKRLRVRNIDRRTILEDPRRLNLPKELRPAFTYCLQVHADYYSPGYIIKNWEDETTAWQAACAIRQTMPTNFITERWDRFSNLVSMLCLQFQDVDPTFLKTQWRRFSSAPRHLCYKYQTMPASIIEHPYNYIGHSNRIIVLNYQYLSMDFILHIWYDLPAYMRQVCFHQQKIIDRVSMAELPMFLVDGDEFVRRRAMTEVAEEVYKW